MIYGYKRPIHGDEQMTGQLREQPVDQVFAETHPNAKKREQLEELLMRLEEGDKVYVQCFLVLADSLTHFHELLRLFQKDGVTVQFVEERIDNRRLLSMNLAEMVGLLTEFQTNLKRHQAVFSLRDAQRRGKPVGRPKKSDDNLKQAFAMYESRKYTLQEIKQETGISKSTLYRYLDQ